ncbi:carboxylic ester hydrolase [Sinosporangium siamense]|uniref:Carboxylic ester hydrolase n=1 Tax=Sinosporangium siamense TaxID=1367973 RepID=A0A919V8C8_9ACTN|nr:carboxylic ester hydrolase [Sinosporangium siamense]
MRLITARRAAVFAMVWAMVGGSAIPLHASIAEVTSRDSVVRTDSGPVRGTVTADKRLFEGIPFAAPPVGDLRWRSPQPVTPWTEPRDATRPGNTCAQLPQLGSVRSESEDCLYLNVTTPRRTNRPLPVMVWVHGGGFTSGSGDFYDASWLVNQGDVVVVTVNYRLGVFGSFSHPDLPGSGAFGLEDQQAALRWVKRNARAFGGDPRNVTVFGESAGALSICAQLTSPSAAGLFHRAIMQSGTCTVNWPKNGLYPGTPEGATLFSSPEEAAGIATQLMAGRGCQSIDCLRAIPAAGANGLLDDPTAQLLSRPVYGTAVLPEDPKRAFTAGRFHRMPLMMGTTRDEERLFVLFTRPGGIDAAQYASLVADSYGDNAAKVTAQYPLSDYESPAVAWSTLATDRVWSCPTLTADRIAAKRAPVYGFEFADRTVPTLGPEMPELPWGAYHGSDLLFLFPLVADRLTEAQRTMSRQIIAYWTRFARTGNPNGHGTPHWPRFRDQAKPVQAFEPGPGGIQPIDFSARHKCGFWDRLY